MLNTKELELKVKEQINEKLPSADLDGIYFKPVEVNAKEGIYVYEENNKYIFAFFEKGKIRDKKEFYAVEEILWCILDEVIFEEAMKYAIKHREEGVDFRKTLFEKETELFSRFGNDFKSRKISEINEILRNHPYS